MAITTVDGLVAALATPADNQNLLVYKPTSLSSMVAGTAVSTWRMTGIPTAPTTPTTAEILTHQTPGAISFVQPTGGKTTYMAGLHMTNTTSSADIQIHDRLAHMGGLSGTVTTAQTVNLDVSGSSNNLVARRGAADYSDVQWWMEWYANTGSSTPTVTINYTRADGTSGRSYVTAALPATVVAGRMYLLGPTTTGEFIRSIQSVQLSGTTGAAGNWGITATRGLGGISLTSASAGNSVGWQNTGLPRVEDQACLLPVIFPASTTSGAMTGTIKLVQG